MFSFVYLITCVINPIVQFSISYNQKIDEFLVIGCICFQQEDTSLVPLIIIKRRYESDLEIRAENVDVKENSNESCDCKMNHNWKQNRHKKL